jgi:hypothetical protein
MGASGLMEASSIDRNYMGEGRRFQTQLPRRTARGHAVSWGGG